MSRIDRNLPAGAPPPEPSPGRRDSTALPLPASGFETRALQGSDQVIARLMRELFGGALHTTEGLLTTPPLPASMHARPEGKELQQILRKLLARETKDRGAAEERLVGVLRDLIEAQDRVLYTLARQTKA